MLNPERGVVSPSSEIITITFDMFLTELWTNDILCFLHSGCEGNDCVSLKSLLLYILLLTHTDTHTDRHTQTDTHRQTHTGWTDRRENEREIYKAALPSFLLPSVVSFIFPVVSFISSCLRPFSRLFNLFLYYIIKLFCL